MATYDEIHGKRVKEFTSDPTLNSSYEGQVWYNSTAGALKSVVSSGAWHSATPQIIGGYSQGSAGTASAMITVGRDKYPSPSPSNRTSGDCEEYNGLGYFTIATNPNPWSFQSTCGTSTAAITACGSLNGTAYQNGSTLWNGSAWTANTALPTPAESFNHFGTQTASIGFGGGTPGSPGYPANAYTGDGEGWTAGPNLSNNLRYGSGCTGTQTAGIAFGGSSPNTSNTEELNGTTWTSAAAIPTTGANFPQGVGAQDSAFMLPGTASPTTATHKYDGTTWSADASTANPRSGRMSSAGDQTSCVIAGAPSNGTVTEEYNFSINTITAAAWSAAPALPGARWNTSGAGTQTAGLCWGGSTGPATPTFLNTTFEYSGSSWAAGGTTPISSINQFGAGIQNAAIGGGGLASPGSNTTTAYTYDGNTWTAITGTPIATKGAGAAGTSVACLIFGSDVPDVAMNKDSYYWNDTSWAEEGALNTSFQNGASGGPTENTAFKAGSGFGSPESTTNFETYNGTAWAAGPALNTSVQQNRGIGSQTECLSIGGYDQITTVERFNGTAWQNSPSLSAGRKQFASSNFTSPGVSGGWVGAGANFPSGAVEHFTEEVSATAAKTLSSS